MFLQKKYWLLWFFVLKMAFPQDAINNQFSDGPYQDEKQVIRLYNGPTIYDDTFFGKQLLQYSIEALLENYYEGTVNQFLSTGDFSFADNYVFTFLGNSWLWNKYYYNGINVNDAFFSGKTYHKLPPLGNTLTLDAINGHLLQGTKRETASFTKK